MSEHTKGPWKVIALGSYSPQVVAERGRGCNVGIADCFDERDRHPGSFGKGSVQSRAEADANAHLMAAAPDLLEALDGLIYSFDRRKAEEVARAAIAKANGK